MTVAPNSIKAYLLVDFGPRQQEVWEALWELGRATDQELAAHLNWPINRVTPRRNELVAGGRALPIDSKRSPYGRMVTVWMPR